MKGNGDIFSGELQKSVCAEMDARVASILRNPQPVRYRIRLLMFSQAFVFSVVGILGSYADDSFSFAGMEESMEQTPFDKKSFGDALKYVEHLAPKKVCSGLFFFSEY